MPSREPEIAVADGSRRGARRRQRERTVFAVLLIALIWFGHGLVAQTLRWRQAIAVRAAGGDPAGGVIASWQPGDPGPRRLERFLSVMEYYLPPGARVALTAPGKPPSEAHYLELWAGYLLPRHRILPRAGRTEKLEDAEYLLSWELPVDHPRLVEVLRHPDGGLYRVKR